ncbi:MAG TPA: ATP-binding protein [Actinomycetota bacterium]|nr:ATP-binding protein [Actinomycetota bacterium]
MALFRSRGDLPRSPDKWRLGLEAALKVSEIAASATALNHAVRQMVETAVALMGAEQGSIMLLDDDGATLVLVASSGLPADVPIGHRVSVGESVAGRVLATGQALRLEEVDADEFVNFVPKSRQISSSLVVPLRVHGRSLGVLSLAISKGSPYHEDDLRVAQMFADQAAGLIYRARLHEQAEQRSSDLMALVESSRGLLGTLDVDDLLQQVLDGSSRLSGSRDGFACLFDENGAITRGVFRGLEKAAIKNLIEMPEIREAVLRGDVACLQEKDVSIAAVGFRTTRGTRGLVVTVADPVILDGREDLLRAFGQQAASAVSSGELYAEVNGKESELSAIIQTVPHPIVLADAHGHIVAINPAAEAVFGISTMFCAGVPVHGNLGNEDVERLIAGSGGAHAEIEVGSPPRTYKASVNDVEVPGAPMGRVLIMDDVTAEREMIQKQRDFVAMIGHELRTPLTLVKGFARTLIRKVDKERLTPEEAREGLATIDTKAAQLERLIEDLLYVSKIETREASLKVDTTEVSDLLKRVAQEVIADHPGRRISVEVAASLEWPCDETKVALVLRHLLENALKYSEDDVVVRAAEDGSDLTVEVVDRGAGILSSDIPQIFERFRQIDGSSTREHGGTGVGLYLCAQLVRMHHGRIWVDSTWGKRSNFSFSIPRREPVSEIVHITSPEARSA